MKKYLRRILNILFIRNEAIEYIEKDNEEQHKKIYDTGKNKLVITKEKIYIYENWNLSKTLDIKEELNRRKFIRYGNL